MNSVHQQSSCKRNFSVSFYFYWFYKAFLSLLEFPSNGLTLSLWSLVTQTWTQPPQQTHERLVISSYRWTKSATISFSEPSLPLSSGTGAGGSGIIQKWNQKTLVPVELLRVPERSSLCTWKVNLLREIALYSSHTKKPRLFWTCDGSLPHLGFWCMKFRHCNQFFLRKQNKGNMSGNETIFQQPIRSGLFEAWPESLIPDRGQGNEDSVNQIAGVMKQQVSACASGLGIFFNRNPLMVKAYAIS